jgi:hypothetical protein
VAAAPQTDPRAREVLNRFAELDDKRGTHATSWQKISEFILPSRTFTVTREAGELLNRQLANPIGVMSAKRLSAFIYGYALSPTDPWVAPMILGRDASSEELAWFEDVELRMHEQLSGSGSPIAPQLFQGVTDIVAFGQAVTYRVRRPGMAPRIVAQPLAQSFVDENADGEVDTNYRRFTLTARRAAERYDHPDLREKAEKTPTAECTFIHAHEPRKDGKRGAASARKPYTSDVVWVEKAALVNVSGYDDFAFQVGRFDKRSGEIYGVGPGWDALPAVRSANVMMGDILRAAEYAVAPVLFGDMSIFGGRLDRRPGAVNPVAGAAAMFGRLQDQIGQLPMGGDVNIGVEMLRFMHGQVEGMFLMDWLTLREAANITATEINERRDLRMRLLAPVVARLEQEWLTPIVSDLFMGMLEAGMFAPPPQSLAGEEIGFTYKSPLTLARNGAFVDAVRRTFELSAAAAQFDQSAPMVLRADGLLREAARKIGIPEAQIVAPEELAAIKQQQAMQAQQAAAAAAAKDAAGALQAGAQGAATLAGAGLLDQAGELAA